MTIRVLQSPPSAVAKRSLPVRRSPNRSTAMVAGLCALLLLAACGGGTDDVADGEIATLDGQDDPATTDGGSADADVDEVATDVVEPAGDAEPLGAAATDEDRALAFADCIRSNDIEVKDPELDAAGNVGVIQMFEGSGVDLADPDFQAILAECGVLLDGGNFGFEDGASQVEESMLAFTECLRDGGVESPDFDWDTAFADGGARFANTDDSTDREELVAILLELDRTDPAVAAGISTCMPELAAIEDLTGG